VDIQLKPPWHTLRLSEHWQPLKTMPDDPPGCRLVNPYDDADDGFLMNLSESHEYDDMFPNHPLTQARLFVAAMGSCAG
jgi:hypothetical protein